MPKSFSSILIMHGCIILLIGNILGVILANTLAKKNPSPQKKEAWRMSHSANTAFGVFLLAVASTQSFISFRDAIIPKLSNVMTLSLIAAGYGFFFATLIGGLTGHKGVKFKGPFWNWVALFCGAIGMLGSFIGVSLIFYGAYLAV